MDNISLRDYFAALAMQGILANWQEPFNPPVVVARAYAIAEAMLNRGLQYGNV